MTKITAAEAAQLSGPTPEERLVPVYERIRETATKREHRNVNLTDEFWTNGGYNKSKDWLAAVKILEADGFRVTFFYEERQFVNMYTVVSW